MRIPRVVTLGVAVLILVACLVVIVWGQLWLHDQSAADDRDADVLAAAQRGATLVLSYDYRRLEAGSTETQALLTGDALTQYADVQQPLAKAAPGLEAVVTAEIKAATVLSADDDSAEVLVFVDQTSSSTKLDAPQNDQSRIVVGLVHQDGVWLISSLAAI